MSSYGLLDSAEADMFEVYCFGVERFGVDPARRFILDLHKIFALLAENPRLGRLAPSIRSGVRRHEHRSHVIVYEETLDGILILAVFRASSVKRLTL